MRKAFNFYLSYWEQIKLLNDKQKLEIFTAICSVQFLEVNINDVEFKDKLCNIVWTGIKHSVESSLKGFLTKSRSIDNEVIEPLPKGGAKAPAEQEKEEGEVQEEEKGKYIYADFLLKFNETTKRKFRILDDKTKRQLNARLTEGFTIEEIIKASKNCSLDQYHIENKKYLTPEFITRSDKLQKYLGALNSEEQITDRNGNVLRIINGEWRFHEYDTPKTSKGNPKLAG